MVSDGMGGRLPWSTRRRIHIVAHKRETGERIEGFTSWDGLADLHAVQCPDGSVKYVSILDQIDRFDPVSDDADQGLPGQVYAGEENWREEAEQ